MACTEREVRSSCPHPSRGRGDATRRSDRLPWRSGSGGEAPESPYWWTETYESDRRKGAKHERSNYNIGTVPEGPVQRGRSVVGTRVDPTDQATTIGTVAKAGWKDLSPVKSRATTRPELSVPMTDDNVVRAGSEAKHSVGCSPGGAQDQSGPEEGSPSVERQ